MSQSTFNPKGTKDFIIKIHLVSSLEMDLTLFVPLQWGRILSKARKRVPINFLL